MVNKRQKNGVLFSKAKRNLSRNLFLALFNILELKIIKLLTFLISTCLSYRLDLLQRYTRSHEIS